MYIWIIIRGRKQLLEIIRNNIIGQVFSIIIWL